MKQSPHSPSAGAWRPRPGTAARVLVPVLQRWWELDRRLLLGVDADDGDIELGQPVPKLAQRSVDLILGQEHGGGLYRRLNLDAPEGRQCGTSLARILFPVD